MRMLVAVGWMICVGCAETDPAIEPEPPPPTPGVARLVQSTVVHQVQSGVDIPFTPMSEGTTLAVAIVSDGGWLDEVRVRSVDGSHEVALSGFTQAEAIDLAPCMRMEIWLPFAHNMHAGMNSLRFSYSAKPRSDATLYIVELVGGLTTNGGRQGSIAGPVASAAAHDTEAGDLVLSGIVTCGALQGPAPDSPFTSLGMLPNADLGFYEVTAAGKHGGAWINDGGHYDTTTTTFRMPRTTP